MVMAYDGALVMPSSYAVMEQEEMTYVEGGGTPSVQWYGVYWELSDAQVNTICKACNFGAGAAGVLSALSAMGIVTSIGTAPAALVSSVLWTYGAALDLMNHLGGNKGLKLRAYWNGTSTITPF